MTETIPVANPKRYNYLGVGLLGVVCVVAGIGGLWYVLSTLYPNGMSAADRPLPQPAGAWAYLAELDSGVMLMFCGLVALTVTGISLPFTWFLNRRFTRDSAPRPLVIVRQAVWVGVWIAALLWLRANQTFNVPLMLITAGALALVELLLLLRQRGAPQ